MTPIRSARAASSSREIKPGTFGVMLDGAIVVALVLLTVAAPHSIAATQTAWLLGLLFWVLRLAVWPRPKVSRTPVDYAMLGFFILTGLAALLSYEPMVSVGKLRQASLFTIVYLVAENVHSKRLLRALAIALVASCTMNVVYTFGQYAVGRGIRVEEVTSNSPLAAAKLVTREKREPFPIQPGDTLLEIDGQKLRSPEQLVGALSDAQRKDPAKLKIYRYEWIPVFELPRGQLLEGGTPEQQLGIQRWSRGRDWRATGFHDHYVTYAESLQLIASLALGLLVALPNKRNRNGLFLALALAGMCGALVLTVTRATWAAFLVSGIIIVALGVSRRALLVIAACALPLILGALFLLHQKRNVGFFDQGDASTTWRETVWREGFHLLTSNPRHLLVGVGMDSIKSHWRQWGLFDGGRLPIGHMHSDYLEIALERGLPALAVWLILMGVYGRMLWQLKGQIPREFWIERGIVFGALGGLIGFLVSGLVHYNYGDSEVVMIFYLVMGLSLVVERRTREMTS
jgi:O-antigen ligase